MGIGVLVIVTERQPAQLPFESFAAGVLFAWFAPAVASPIAEGFRQCAQHGLIGQNTPSFAHGHMVCRIKANGSQVAKGADLLALEQTPNSVAAVFDEPESMATGEVCNRAEVKRVAQSVSQNNGSCFLTIGFLELTNIDVVSRHCYVKEDGNEPVLDDRVDRGGKTRG